MPRNLATYSECAPPGIAYSWTSGGNWVGDLIGSLVLGGAAGVAYTAVMTILGQAATLGCAIGIGFGAFATAGIVMFKTWYYNYRLMCIQHDRCACGTMVGEPTDADDGDRKMDIHLAPFHVRESEQKLIEVLDEMRGTLANVPDVADLQNRQILFGYIKGLSEADADQVYYKLIDDKLMADPAHRFQRHYWRKDETEMGTAAFNAASDDDPTSADPNPMFRYRRNPGKDTHVPFMHCEVEGNRLGRWLDNVLAGVIAGLVAYLAICVLCEVVTLGVLDFLCGILGGLFALLIAFLAWLISHFVNDPDDGVAGNIDVDVDDPAFDTPDTEMRDGDVVLVFGDWIMDTEHDEYFEIHPIRAYYLLCESQDDVQDWHLTETVPPAECAMDPRKITGDSLDRMCRIVMAAENTDPEDRLDTKVSHALAMMPEHAGG